MRGHNHARRRPVLWGALAVLLAGCSGGGSTNGGVASPSPPPASGGTNGPAITIANNTATPKNITIVAGSRVTFVNADSQAHDMQSDPHPVHTDCPEINQVGLLSAGQTRQTGPLTVARTCGYHDHHRDMVESLKGTITIQ